MVRYSRRRKPWISALLASAGITAAAPCLAGEAKDRIIGGTVFAAGVAGALARGPHQEARPLELIPRQSWIVDELASDAEQLGLDPNSLRSAAPIRGDAAAAIARFLRRSAGDLQRPSTVSGPGPGVVPPFGMPPAPSPEAVPAAPPAEAPPASSSVKPPETDTDAVGPNDLVLPGGHIVHRSPPGARNLPALESVLRANPRVWLLAWEFRPELQLEGISIPESLNPRSVRALFSGVTREQVALTGGRPHLDALALGSADGIVHGFHYTASASTWNPGGFDQPFHLSAIGDGPITSARPLVQYDARSRYLRGVNRLAAWRTFDGWRLEAGRDALQWGTAYSGSLILSDNTGPLDKVQVDKNFNLGRLGEWRLHEFLAYDHEAGVARYLLARRIEKPLSSHWDGSVTEALISQGTPPPLALALPIYLVSSKGGESADNRQNYLIDFQMAYADSRRSRYYADVLFDDILFPIPFPGEYAPPRKAGFLAGTTLADPMKGIGQLVLEAVYTDATIKSTDTYLHRNPLVAYARFGQIIGNPIGPGSSGVVARANLTERGPWSSWMQATIEQHHRTAAHPDVESAAWLGVARRWGSGRSLALTVRPYYVQNEDTLWGKNHFRLDGQASLSFQF